VVIFLSALLAVLCVALFYNGRRLADARQISSLASTLESYCQVLQTQKMVYVGFYESLPPYRKTLQNLSGLSQAVHPLAEMIVKLSNFSLGEYRPFGGIEGLGDKMQGSIAGIAESLRSTEKALGNFDEDAHAEVLLAIDQTIADLNNFSQLLHSQAATAERSAWLMLVSGLLVSCLFFLLGFAVLPESQIVGAVLVDDKQGGATAAEAAGDNK